MTRPTLAIILALFSLLAACGDDGGGGGDRDGGGGGVDADDPGILDGGDTTDPFDLCEGGCACSDGMDNDGDMLIDGMDPECTGPFDEDESSFATGIPGDNRDPMWQDCFFDGNSGAGDDGCRYHTECLTGEREATAPTCEVTASCLEFCRARTPNGCDCFGCCEVTLPDMSTRLVQIGGTCSLETIDDTSRCPTCVQDDDCYNECGMCELCLGRTEEDLDPSCYPDSGMPYVCEDGIACATDADCPGTDDYCSLGCCLGGLI